MAENKFVHAYRDGGEVPHAATFKSVTNEKGETLEEIEKRQSDINAHILEAVSTLEDTDTVIVKTKIGLRKITAKDLRDYCNYGLNVKIETI